MPERLLVSFSSPPLWRVTHFVTFFFFLMDDVCDSWLVWAYWPCLSGFSSIKRWSSWRKVRKITQLGLTSCWRLEL